MTTAIIVQARWGSTRAPGKVLAPIGGRTALALTLARCARVHGVDAVVCAVADDSASDAVAEEAARCGAIVTRGSQSDVLARYAAAARAVRADVVLRVTSDCPLIDPALCADVLAWRAACDADYACNNAPAGYPHGLDCEAFTADALAWSAAHADDAATREHVTPDLRTNVRWIRARIIGPCDGAERLRWTLDWPEDIAFLQALADHVDVVDSSWESIARACMDAPTLTAINASRVDDARLATLQVAAADQTVWPQCFSKSCQVKSSSPVARRQKNP